MNYYEKKEKVRQEAIEWSLRLSEGNLYLSEIMEISNRFYKLGKRYGLLKEFRENGIC